MIHRNSLLADREMKYKKGCRHNQILQVFHITGRPMTDREIKNFLRVDDMNAVRPRITELIDDGRLVECGEAKDVITGKTVRLTRMVRPEERTQMALF